MTFQASSSNHMTSSQDNNHHILFVTRDKDLSFDGEEEFVQTLGDYFKNLSDYQCSRMIYKLIGVYHANNCKDRSCINGEECMSVLGSTEGLCINNAPPLRKLPAILRDELQDIYKKGQKRHCHCW